MNSCNNNYNNTWENTPQFLESVEDENFSPSDDICAFLKLTHCPSDQQYSPLYLESFYNPFNGPRDSLSEQQASFSDPSPLQMQSPSRFDQPNYLSTGLPSPPSHPQDPPLRQEQPHDSILVMQSPKREYSPLNNSLLIYGFNYCDSKSWDDFLELRHSFFQAIAAGNLIGCKKYLATYPTLINAKLNNGDTPLHSAIQKGHRDLIVFLLNMRANLIAKNGKGKTASDLALEQGYSLDQLPDLNSFKMRNTKIALRTLQTFLVSCTCNTRSHQKLLKRYPILLNAQEPKTKNTGLHTAIQAKQWEIASYLLKKKANPMIENAQNKNATDLAKEMGLELHALPTFAHFLDACRNPEGHKLLPGMLQQNPELLDRKESHYGDTGLHIAVKKGLSTHLDVLLQHGANTSLQNNLKKTAYAIAIDKNKEDIISLFLSSQTDAEGNQLH